MTSGRSLPPDATAGHALTAEPAADGSGLDAAAELIDTLLADRPAQQRLVGDPLAAVLAERALEAMTCLRRPEVVSGAIHLFEEPGALEQMAALAAKMMERRA